MAAACLSPLHHFRGCRVFHLADHQTVRPRLKQTSGTCVRYAKRHSALTTAIFQRGIGRDRAYWRINAAHDAKIADRAIIPSLRLTAFPHTESFTLASRHLNDASVDPTGRCWLTAGLVMINL